MTRRRRPPPCPWADDDKPLRLVRQRAEREAYARQRADHFRTDMDEAARLLRVWAAQVARSRQAEWYSYETATRLIAVELGREALTVARNRLRAGASLDQAVRHAIAVTEEMVGDVVQRVGPTIDKWTPRPVPDDAKTAERRRRISRLRAKADSSEFPEEAATFRAKAEELAQRYRIEV